MPQVSSDRQTLIAKGRITEKIESEYGKIDYKQWCSLEANRIRCAGGDRKYHEANGYCWVN